MYAEQQPASVDRADVLSLLGERIRSGLEQTEHISAVDGRGLLLGVQLTADVAADVVARGRAAGLILNAPTPSRIRLVPPLVITDAQVEAFLETFPVVVAEAIAGAGS
ncbi:MAG: aminotransferase class III-fold pyridoxal phosphate-dependent enzyme [Myxococcales bacterium]|nr:MAG: aminotransferase class III-fold pyridoxal phosphate-dependent enzyme [Myxococcales bacterium]